MNNNLNLKGKLDFSEIDLTAPEIVIDELLSQLPKETNGLICGKIKEYDGYIMSYRKPGLSSIAAAIGTAEKEIDIQNDLGEIGTETHKFECYLYTPEYEKYRYRMFFIKYNISNYPATVVLENSIAKSISTTSGGYIYVCNTRNDLEELIISILTSKRIIAVMQELIRVSQAQKLSTKCEAVSQNIKDE